MAAGFCYRFDMNNELNETNSENQNNAPVASPAKRKMTYRQFRRWLLKEKGISLGYAYPGNMSSNWDGTWWMVEFTGGEYEDQIPTQHVTISATKKWNGMAFCRQKATEKAFAEAAKQFNIEVDG